MRTLPARERKRPEFYTVTSLRSSKASSSQDDIDKDDVTDNTDDEVDEVDVFEKSKSAKRRPTVPSQHKGAQSNGDENEHNLFGTHFSEIV